MPAKSLTVAILQPAYLPWLGYFDQMGRADVFVHYDDVQLSRKSWHHRNRVKTPAGEDWLSVPVTHTGGRPVLIKDALIDPQVAWAKRHLGVILGAYRQAPFFALYYDRLQDVLGLPWKSVRDLNVLLATWLWDCLMATQPARKRPPGYMASQLGVAQDLDTTARPLAICQRLGATRFLCGPTAKAYINEGAFADAGIELVWHDYQPQEYPQLWGPWIPRLSALDALMMLGPAAGEMIGR